jgi:hypothetical protein
LIEAGVSVAVAVLAGAAALTNRMHSRISDVDRRVDGVELLVVRDYITKDEYMATMTELKEQMIRIENKLDAFIQNYPRR